MQILEYLSWVDGLMVLTYLVATALLGLTFHRQSSATEFLLANRGMGWLPVGLSVMATLFSANSFLMVPGETFRNNMLVVAGMVSVVATVPIIMRWFIPIYVRSGCFTAYELLEKRFDVRVRLLAALLFILLRAGWMAAATFACSLAVAVISGTDLYLTIWVMGIVTTIYTVTGGIKAVMWNDVLQFVVFAAAIIGAVIVATLNVPGGWSGTWASYESAGKMQFLDLRWDMSLRLGTWALLFGQFVENLSAYATDQSIVQRYLTARSEAVCRRAFLANIAGVLVVVPGLMVLGVSLSGFYRAHPDRLAAAPAEYFLRRPGDLEKVPGLADAMAVSHHTTSEAWLAKAKSDPGQLTADLTARYRANPLLAEQDLYGANRQDEVMPLFVRREMPKGMAGLVIAALLAATMSSVAGGIHSIATSIVVDIRARLFNRGSDMESTGEVRFVRVLTLVLGVITAGLACIVDRLGPVFDMSKKLNGLFSGPLLALFTMAFFVRRARAMPALVATVLGAGFTGWLTSLNQVRQLPAWMTSTGTISPVWFCVLGFLTTLAVGVCLSLLVPCRGRTGAQQ